MQNEQRKYLAKLTSDILNPFSISLLMIILLSLTATSSITEALKWSLISIALSILPVFATIIYLVHNQRLEGIFIKVRQQRHRIYRLATLCAVVSCFVLYYGGAPRVLVATFVTGLSTVVIFMFINLLWKISVHTAFVSASVTILIILFGATGAIASVLVPPIAWSRIELEHHSPAQVITGALLAALIVPVTFYLFGLIGAEPL